MSLSSWKKMLGKYSGTVDKFLNILKIEIKKLPKLPSKIDTKQKRDLKSLIISCLIKELKCQWNGRGIKCPSFPIKWIKKWN